MASEFAQVEAFSGLDEEGLAALQEASTARIVSGGDYLVRYGEEASSLYLVSTGRFFVQLPNGRVVAEIGAGEPIGELAFFSGGVRTADVRATRDSLVFQLDRADYDKVVASHPAIAESILKVLSTRLSAATGQLNAMEAKPAKVLALIPGAGSQMPEGFCERFCKALTIDEPPRMVTIDEKPSGLNADSEDFRQWLGGIERSAERIVLVASGDEDWDRAITRNADDLVIVAPLFEEECERSALEEYAIPLFLRTNRTLLLWRERAEREITGSGRWLDTRNVKLHHHIALDDDKDFARVGRFLTGRANGVVLAGGGALGCAHIGVIRGLIDNGIPVDFYGGTSAGAAMGGAIAQGLTPEETIIQCEEMFIKAKAMKKMTIPVHSILDPRVFDRELEKRYSNKDIADLPYNFFGVSTNLSTNSIYLHRRGPLWHAVRASGSLPTILPPFITEEGDILVDGGVLDNIPVAIMREAKAGPNVVVSLRSDAGEDWRTSTKYSSLRTPWQIFRDIIFRRKPKEEFPGIVDIMSRSMVVTSASIVKHSLSQADVLLVPPIPEGMKILDWHLGKELAASAAEYTAQRIAEHTPLQDMQVQRMAGDL